MKWHTWAAILTSKWLEDRYKHVILGSASLVDWINLNLIQDGSTQRASVINLCMVKRTEECYPCSCTNCLEFDTCNSVFTFSMRMELNFGCFIHCKCFNEHRTMAPVLCISNYKAEVVESVGDCSNHLRNGTLSPSYQFNSG